MRERVQQAVISIFDADLENAAVCLDLARGVETAAADDEQEEQTEAPAKPKTHGKRCDTCGARKARQAFRGGGDTCTQCQKAQG